MPAANQPLVYVSYAWRSRSPDGQAAQLNPSDGREAIVEELCGVLDQEDQIVVGRDKKLVKTGNSIVDFAGDIACRGLILAVISHKSLRSDWCMVHELLQAFRRRNFSAEEFGSDVLALVLEDALDDIRDPREPVKHWLALLEKKQVLVQLANPGKTGSPESWKGVDQLAERSSKMPDLIRILRTRAIPRGAEANREQGFRAIRKLMLQRTREKYDPSKKKFSTISRNQFLGRLFIPTSATWSDREILARPQLRVAPIAYSVHHHRQLWESSQSGTLLSKILSNPWAEKDQATARGVEASPQDASYEQSTDNAEDHSCDEEDLRFMSETSPSFNWSAFIFIVELRQSRHAF